MAARTAAKASASCWLSVHSTSSSTVAFLHQRQRQHPSATERAVSGGACVHAGGGVRVPHVLLVAAFVRQHGVVLRDAVLPQQPHQRVLRGGRAFVLRLAVHSPEQRLGDALVTQALRLCGDLLAALLDDVHTATDGEHAKAAD